MLAKWLALLWSSIYTSVVHRTLIVASIVLGAYSPIRYIQDIRKGRSTPHRVTRFALCVSLVLTFFSTMAAHGSVLALLLIGGYAACGMESFRLSMRKGVGVGGTSKSDVFCLVAALAGTAGWALSGDPVVAVVCSIVADITAYIPTVIQTRRNPTGESHWTYTLSAIAAGISVMIYPFTTGSWFPAYLVFIGTVMVLCIKLPALLRNSRKVWLRLKRA